MKRSRRGSADGNPGGGGSNPNEPAGFTVISDRAFNADGENGWSANTDAGGNFSIVTDATAPRSPSNVGQANYPVGFSLVGNDPIDTHIGVSSYNYTQLYMSFWVKLSNPWQPGAAATNKIGFVWCASQARVYTRFAGSSFPMEAQICIQSTPSGTQNLSANITSTPLQMSTWYHWEVLLQMNTAGNFDGVARWWVDGVEQGNYTNIGFVSSGESHIWGAGGDGVSWKPILGGAGSGSLTVAQNMWIDHWYVSGKA